MSARPAGFALLPVTVMLALLAVAALVLSRESLLGADRVARAFESREAELVAQAGLAHAGWRLREAGCRVPADLGATSFQAHSYSAAFATDASGSETTYTLAVDQDTWLKEQAPGSTNGGAGELQVRNLAGDGYRAAYRFDLSALPGGARISSATAWFHVLTPDVGDAVAIHAITADWTEAGANWSNLAAQIDPARSGSIAATRQNAWMAVDLAPLVQAWTNGALPNRGLMLVAASAAVESRFTSREYGDVSGRPWLEVVVTTGAPPSTAAIDVAGTLASGVGRSAQRRDLSAVPAGASGLVYQPGAAGVADGWITALKPNWNYGAHTSLKANDSGGQRSLLRFDALPLPRGASVRRAVFGLTATQVFGTGEVALHAVTTPWLEGTCQGSGCTADGATWDWYDGGSPWAVAGADHVTQPAARAQVSAAGLQEFDLTDLVSAWVSGRRRNDGLLIQGTGGANVTFASSDHGDAASRPRLVIEYHCTCGVRCLVPSGSGELLLVVDDAVLPSAGDQARRALFESWGYTVNLVSDHDLSLVVDLAVAASDVVYVSDSVNATTLGGKLDDAPVGVVSEEGLISDRLGISSGVTWPVGETVEVTDAAHPITGIFAPGPLRVFDAPMEGVAVAGTLAPGLRTLAAWGTAGALTALEAGDITLGGAGAPARRVLLPLGRGVQANFNRDYLNNNGLLLVQRAIEWAATGTAPVAPGAVLMVVTSTLLPTGQELQKRNLIESWGFDVAWIAQGASQGGYDAAMAVADVVFVGEDANAGTVGTKLSNAPIGVVTEEDNLSDELGLAQSIAWGSGTAITIDDAGHYITEPFAPGPLTVLHATEALASMSGALAPHLLQLGAAAGSPALVALEAGTAAWGGGTAPGRRVLLPWGGSDMDVDSLNGNGLTLFRRALEWGARTPPVQVSVQVSAANDDAEEAPFGVMLLDSSDLELVRDNFDQTVGIRFASVPVPAGATIDAAYIDFTADETDSVATSLVIHAEDADDPPAFSSAGGNITGRILTGASVAWDDLPAWTTVPQIRTTPNLVDLVQGLVERPGWAANNAMVFVISGSGTRTAEAYDGEPGLAPVLRVAFSGGEGGEGAAATYTEAFSSWSATDENDWQVRDLGAFGVPSNAVVEVAVYNTKTGNERWGGVRATGSSLERRLRLHEAESGGADALVMHVQADGDARIEHYAEKSNEVGFILLGWWTGAVYEERFATFQAGGSGNWRTRDLSAFGVGPGQVAEIVVANTASNGERLAGVRPAGFPGNRWAALHEAESGGVDAGTALVTADGGGAIEVFADDDGDVDFHLMGLWSTPPGSYTELDGASYWQAGASGWEDRDLTALGVPAGAVATVAIVNLRDTSESAMGLRAAGSALQRRLTLHEAEAGGGELAMWHVATDAAGAVQSYSQLGGSDFRFYPFGYWTLP